MSKMQEDINIEWKKSGFESSEKVSRRINEQKAAQYDAYKRNGAQKISALTPTELPQNLNKLRKKIRDAYDEEDEEEDDYLPTPPSALFNTSLVGALSADEKQNLAEKETLKTMDMQQKALQMSVLDAVEKFSRSAGLGGVKKQTTAMALTAVGAPDKLLEKAVNFDIAQRFKTRGHPVKAGDVNAFFRGIKRIEAISGGKTILRGMNVKDIIRAGETKSSDSKVNKIVLKKSGRRLFPRRLRPKKYAGKAQREFNKIFLKKTMLKTTAR